MVDSFACSPSVFAFAREMIVTVGKVENNKKNRVKELEKMDKEG